MGLFDRFKKDKINGDEIFMDLPEPYKNFLEQNPNGSEQAFNEYKDKDPDYEGRNWNLMGKKELMESWEMNGVGRTRNYECLKLYVQVQKEFMLGESTTSNVGKIPLSRVESGFVVGDENGDYLYLDPSDYYSVWIYYHDGGDVLRVANSFEEFISH